MEYHPAASGIIQDMEMIHLPHWVYHCDYHVVIVTKYRKALFNEGVFAYFRQRLAEVSEHYPLIIFKEVNTDKDHIHLLVSIPPTMGVGKVVGIIKQNTARELKQKFPFIREAYWGTEAVWSEGYFVTTVGMNEEVIKRYIQQQGEEDAGRTKFVTN